jgi:hypothetical protein
MMKPFVSFCQRGIGCSESVVAVPNSGVSIRAVSRLGGTVEAGLRGVEVKGFEV